MKYFILTTLLIISLSTFGQTKVVYFLGYGLYQYQNPVQVDNGEYQAYYQNMGETFEKGRIILDTINKSFTIKWLNGDDWIAKYIKATKKNGYDPIVGDQQETTYNGNWTDDNMECALTIKNNQNGCVFQVKSGKVKDEDYKIDTWKKIFTLFTQGECLQEQQ